MTTTCYPHPMDDMDYQKKPLKDWRVLLYITTAFSFLGSLGESAFLARDHLFTVITPWFIDACALFRRGAARHPTLGRNPGRVSAGD